MFKTLMIVLAVVLLALSYSDQARADSHDFPSPEHWPPEFFYADGHINLGYWIRPSYRTLGMSVVYFCYDDTSWGDFVWQWTLHDIWYFIWNGYRPPEILEGEARAQALAACGYSVDESRNSNRDRAKSRRRRGVCTRVETSGARGAIRYK